MESLDFPATAKRVIYLFMSGAPSQIDMFDYKPVMGDRFDKDLPDSAAMVDDLAIVKTVHDLNATMLHSLGVDHERLTYRYQGRDFRLPDVAGRVVRDILS